MLKSKSRLEYLVEAFNECVAFVEGDRTLKYSDLGRLFGQTKFSSLNLHGVRVAVLLPDGIAAYISHFVLFVKKAIHVPISPKTTSERIRSIVGEIKPHIFITTKLLAERHEELLPSFGKVIVLDDSCQNPIDLGTMLLDALTEGIRGVDFSASTIRYVIFTSGSTGVPKGVCLSESNIIAAADMNVTSLGLDVTRCSVVGVPLYDYYGLIQIYSHLQVGACMKLGGALMFPSDINKKLSGPVTDLVTVPFALANIIRKVRDHGISSFRNLRVITSSSDMLPDSLLEQVFEFNPTVRVFDIYGLTEAGRASFKQLTKDNFSNRSLGQSVGGVSVSLCEETESNGVAEIEISGPNVMVGYFRGIEAEHLLIKHYAVIRTGDLGERTGNGEIRLVGRAGHIINIRGSKIHPVEIEEIALAMEGLLEARASSFIFDGEVRVRLDVVLGTGAFDEAGLWGELRRKLPAVFVPVEINYCEQLNRTEMGSKIIRIMESCDG